MKNKLNNCTFRAIMTITMYFIIDIILSLILYLLQINIGSFTANQKVLYSIACNIILTTVFIIWYKKDLIKYYKDFKNKPIYFLDTGFKYYFIGLIIMAISNIAISNITNGSIASNEQAVQNMITASPYLTLISTSVFAPFIEEITFRQTFKDLFKNKYLFIIISGVAFGMLHVVFSANSLLEYLYIIPYSSLGISFAYMLYKTDNLLVPISMHFFHNTVLTIIAIIL